jgi:hypothetical protein
VKLARLECVCGLLIVIKIDWQFYSDANRETSNQPKGATLTSALARIEEEIATLRRLLMTMRSKSGVGEAA